MRKINKRNPSSALQDFINEEIENNRKPVYEGGLDSKEEYKPHFFKIRKQLVEEQNHICCYCQQRINIEEGKTPAMKLEHFKPKDLYNGSKLDDAGQLLPDLSLDYSNFLAACVGYDKGTTHCDSCKGGKELKDIPNPASKDFSTFKIRYIAYDIVAGGLKPKKESDRLVKVKPLWNDKIQLAIKENNTAQVNYLKNNDPLVGTVEGCLNLNHPTLQSRRYTAWKAVLNVIELKCGKYNDWHTDKGKKVIKDILRTYQVPDSEDKLKPFCQVIVDLLQKKFKVS